MVLVAKHKVSLTVKWLTRVDNPHIIAPGRSVMLPEVVGRVSLYHHQAQTPEKQANNRALQYARWLTKLKPEERIYYTSLNHFTTLASNA